MRKELKKNKEKDRSILNFGIYIFDYSSSKSYPKIL